MAQKKRKKQRAKQHAAARRARAQQKRKKRQSRSDAPLLHGAVGGVKMSEVLDEFIHPYVEENCTREDLEKLCSMAVIAWNLALMPPADCDSGLIELLDSFPASRRAVGAALLQELIERKLEHFGQYQRLIMDFHLTEEPDGGYHLDVVSTIN